MKTTIVIPARLGSTRLPEKALADIHGKPMIQHVYERAKAVPGVDQIVVATDHAKIVKAVEHFGGQAMMTPESLNSGTERVAFVAKELSRMPGSPEIFINVQGDEPRIDPSGIQRSLELVKSKKFTMATAAAKMHDAANLSNPNVVKALVDHDQKAVYFSRYAIPYSRVQKPKEGQAFACLHHLGLYVYTTQTLLKFASLPPTEWEVAESLEQLRALYYGIPIGVALADKASTGVDTLEDLEAVRKELA